jgi:prohibitin 2
MKARIAALLLAAPFVQGCGCSVVSPGERGVKVYLGEVSPNALPEGLVWHAPFVTSIETLSVKQQTQEMKSECYSADLQQVNAQLKVLFRLPPDNVVTIFQKYHGDPFDSLVSPRVNEALKEVTAQLTAEQIVKSREKVKVDTLKLAKQKVGDLVEVVDIVIENLDLTKQLEEAIESKMVMQQEAAKAEFTKQKAKIEAETAAIKAKGEADAINIRGAAIRDNPRLIDLQIAEKWNGVSPLVIGSSSNILLGPIKTEQK